MAISGLFVWLVIRSVDAGAAFDELTQATTSYYIPAAVILMMGIWIRAIRWKILLTPLGNVKIGTAFAALTIGYLANNALPARLGEFVRVYVLNRDTKMASPAILGTIILERIFDVLTLMILLSLAALASGWRSPWNVPLAGLAVGAIAAFVMMYLVVSGLIRSSTPIISNLVRILERPLGGGIPRLVSLLTQGFTSVRSRRSLFTIVVLSAASWLIESAVYFLVLLAFDIDEGSYWLAIVVASIANLSGLIPAGPGNIGTFEFFAKEAAMLAGIDEEKALAFAIAVHFVVLMPPTVIGVLFTWRRAVTGTIRFRNRVNSE